MSSDDRPPERLARNPMNMTRNQALVLAVSSYQGDMQALALVSSVHASGAANRFASIAVVDSGDLAACRPLELGLAERFPAVHYEHHEGNLGSAGNLVARLRWAGRVGGTLVLAVNADGHVEADNVDRLLACADRPAVAAVYPAFVIADRWVDLTFRQPIPVLPFRRRIGRLGRRTPPLVRWGSSNGALYDVAAVSSFDLERVAGLWYGWEDLAIGIALHRSGSRQLLCLTASQATPDDLRPLANTSVLLYDKPPWTAYYSVRNLVLLGRWRASLVPLIALRIMREFGMTALRDQRPARLALGLRGLIDGLRGVTGMHVLPGTEPPRGASV
jgi:hypothetical protein